jgi:hypothetical protein
VQWALAADGTVAGFLVRPQGPPQPQEAPSQDLGYRTKTPLRLPFTGEWFVVWGGRTVAENYHAATRDQRFAYDLVILRGGKSHAGDGSANEQYAKKGDQVKAGDLLGLCGNSGNSSEPHLHYHLQTTAEFGKGEGLPAQFQGYVADGEDVERGEPRKGQAIRPQPK